ncbi:MAG: COR domain-containing protein, partial [Saprospiraceae bacterium]
MSQLALDLIAKEREKKTGFLNLGNCGLTEIPEEVFELDWLIFLSFSPSDKNKGNRNQITQIDKKISRLTKLIFLVLNDNDISDIKQITLCKSIKHLSLKNNKKLKDISPIQNLVNLETLILKGTSIEDKSHLNNLKLLKHLDISELENQTDKTRTPSRLENLKDLEVLKVTLVDTFDFSIFKKLKTLHITYWHCYNYLEDLSIIGKITTLEDLLINYIDQGFGDEDYSKHAMEYRYKGKIKDLSFLKDLTKLKELTLTNHRIKDTEILKNFPQLEKLNLSKNRIINTNGLKELHHLKELKFNSCGLSSLDFISKSKSLQWLEINDNCITDLLPIQELSNLEILEINNNNVSDIQALKNLSLLRFLEIEKNDISDISMAESFKELVLLKAGNNNIVRIEGLKGLTEITILDLSHNLIEDIPKLEHYEKLSYLNLESNNIVDIKNLLSFFQYGKTTYWSNKEYLPRLDDEENFITTDKNNIILIGNPIKNPPIEIVKEGRQAIINYFDQLKVQGEDYLFEAKMIILGESGAGKTTFFRKIKDNNADLPKDKETTLGINSEPWFFEISSEDIDKAIDKPLKNKKAINAIKEQGFRVNRWDFGGQEIYHSTHQFFLSHRSFYVLLADTREQKTDFNYWLNIAEQRSGESPLMVVLNEKHGHTWTIDEYGFKQRFPFYKETYNLNLAEVNDFTKLELLRDKVKDYVLNLPHIGDTLPANWVQIRLNLSSLNEKYISLDKFREICKEHDISKIDDILTMSQYFHDIGVFIHFHNNSILKNRIFLDANWTTETIYDLLNDQQIKDELGRFSKNYVHSIWNDEDCLMIIDELLELLNEFGLAYPVDKNNFIIPQRLSQGKPYEHWQYENEPQLLFSYTFDKFMPKGLMSR